MARTAWPCLRRARRETAKSLASQAWQGPVPPSRLTPSPWSTPPAATSSRTELALAPRMNSLGGEADPAMCISHFCRGQPDFARPSANPIRGLPGFARHSANPDDGRWRVFVAPPIRRRLGSRRPTTCRDTGCCLSPWDTGGVDRPVIRHIFQLWGLAGVKVLARSDPTRRPGPGLWAHVRGVVGPGSRGRGFCRSCSALAAESEAGCPPAP